MNIEDVPTRIVYSVNSPSCYGGHFYPGSVVDTTLYKSKDGWRYSFGSLYAEEKSHFDTEGEAHAELVAKTKILRDKFDDYLKSLS